MKKVSLILLCAILFLPFLTFGQEAKEGTVEMNKKDVPCFIAISKYQKSDVEDAITGQLKDAGMKKYKKKKNFYIYKKVSWPDICPNMIDLYYKVAKKKHKSKIYFIVSKGYDNYVTSANDATTSANITHFLGRINDVVAHNLEVQKKEEEVKQMNEKLAKKQAALKKAEKEKNKKDQELNDLKNGNN